MKQFLLVLLFIQIFYGCTNNESEDPGFTVTGKFSEIDEPVIVRLSYTDDSNREISEEVVAKDGEFAFKGKTVASGAELLFMPYDPEHDRTTIEYWTFANKVLNEKKYFINGTRSFFLEKGHFKFIGKDDLVAARLETNSKNQELYANYLKEFNSLTKPYFDLAERKDQDSISSNPKEVASLDKALKDQLIKITDYAYDFASKHPGSIVTLVALKGDGLNINPEKLRVAVNNLSKELQATPVCEKFRELVAVAKRSEIGNDAIDFNLDDANGNKRKLSSFKGKYVLVDFWASWCAPCRAENLNVLKAYNNFKNEKFEIISISIDSDNNDWLKAVQEDGLPWLNLIDGKTANKSIAKKYGIIGVPSNFLIDPAGKIVAKNLRGEELGKKLAKIIK